MGNLNVSMCNDTSPPALIMALLIFLIYYNHTSMYAATKTNDCWLVAADPEVCSSLDVPGETLSFQSIS